MYVGPHVKYLLFLSEFNFVDGFAKNTRASNFMKIYSEAAELFHAGGRADKHDMIYLLTAVGLSPGGSTHLHTNST